MIGPLSGTVIVRAGSHASKVSDLRFISRRTRSICDPAPELQPTGRTSAVAAVSSTSAKLFPPGVHLVR